MVPQLGQAIETVHAELLPEEKVAFIKELKTKIGPIVMVGDGMNDAPALAAADIGISMGISGAAVAIETGHVTLMSNDMRKIPIVIRLSRETRRRIVENVIISIVTKVAILALALAGHPLVWAAVAADVGTCLLVIFNSMRLRGGTFAVASTEKKKNKCYKKTSQRKSHRHQHGCSDGHSKGNHNHNHRSHSSCNGGSGHAAQGDFQAELGCHAYYGGSGCCDSAGKKPKSVFTSTDVEIGLGEMIEGHGHCSRELEIGCHSHEHSCCSDSMAIKPESILVASADVETRIGLKETTEERECVSAASEACIQHDDKSSKNIAHVHDRSHSPCLHEHFVTISGDFASRNMSN